MSAMTVWSESEAVEAISRDILGSSTRWRTPSAGWNELDEAVASGTVAEVDSRTMQAIGWALLVQRATTLDEARTHARAGLAATKTALDAARQVLRVTCATTEGATCAA
jgi:hypothetical protein